MEEIKEGFESSGVVISQDIANMLGSIDTNGSGEIDYTEFLAATVDAKQFMKVIFDGIE